jgi:hypothetical protein
MNDTLWGVAFGAALRPCEIVLRAHLIAQSREGDLMNRVIYWDGVSILSAASGVAVSATSPAVTITALFRGPQ